MNTPRLAPRLAFEATQQAAPSPTQHPALSADVVATPFASFLAGAMHPRQTASLESRLAHDSKPREESPSVDRPAEQSRPDAHVPPVISAVASNYHERADRDGADRRDRIDGAARASERRKAENDANSVAASERISESAPSSIPTIKESAATSGDEQRSDAQAGPDAATPSSPPVSVGVGADPTPALLAATTGAVTPERTLASAAPATGTAGSVESTLQPLAPEFRARLERVIGRMREEFGHTVEVVETYRSQSRQDALFAQGRTQPGEVVTWTHDSNHTLGRAADVRIDGGYDDAIAFAQLARVAEEEGLHTLGFRDPGHLELTSQGLAGRTPPRPATNASLGQPSLSPSAVPVARVARVADISPIATVAEIARVARPGEPAGVGLPSLPRELTETAVASSAGRPGRRPDGDDRRERTIDPAGLSAKLEVDQSRAVLPVEAMQGGAAAHSSTQDASSIAHSDAAERIARMLKLQDTSGERMLSQVLLRIDHADGTEDRIRVDRRGSSIGATLDMSDAGSAELLRSHVGELQLALERQGLASEALAIRSADAAAKSGDASLLARAAALGGEGITRSAAGAASGGSSRGSTADQSSPRDGRTGPDQNRNRSRREQRGTK